MTIPEVCVYFMQRDDLLGHIRAVRRDIDQLNRDLLDARAEIARLSALLCAKGEAAASASTRTDDVLHRLTQLQEWARQPQEPKP